MESLIKTEEIKLDQEKLQEEIQTVMREVFSGGDAESMQKQMKDDNFSRAISMEAVNRTITGQLFERLKLIATGQPIPEEEPMEALWMSTMQLPRKIYRKNLKKIII